MHYLLNYYLLRPYDSISIISSKPQSNSLHICANISNDTCYSLFIFANVLGAICVFLRNSVFVIPLSINNFHNGLYVILIRTSADIFFSHIPYSIIFYHVYLGIITNACLTANIHDIHSDTYKGFLFYQILDLHHV